MPTTIKKWGNSLAIRLPKEITKRFKLEEGSRIDIAPESKRIIIKPTGNKDISLRELVKGITKENRHKEIDWGPPVGREVW